MNHRAYRVKMIILAFVTLACHISKAQSDSTTAVRWHIKDPHTTEWTVKSDTGLPHGIILK